MDYQENDDKNLMGIILSNGYISDGYGYKKITANNTHWITLFKDKLQMYAYFTGNVDFELGKEYDTGIISVSECELKQLIDILVNNHL